MKRIKLKKGYIAGVLALLLVVATVWLPNAYAAGAIDTNRTCSLTLKVGEGQFQKDLTGLTLEASLYKVADISATGAYTDLGSFTGLKLSEIDSTTSAAIWQEKAKAADKVVADAQDAGKPLTVDGTITITNGTGKLSGIPQGMYLVRVSTVQNEYYEYSFMPFLISVPNNLYYQTGNDSWIYDVTADVKPEQSPRTGAVEIVKTLSAYNTSLGTAMFVFQIDAVDVNGETVYSNVVGIDFNAAGTKSIKIEGIPAGSTVTVTEIYSGASYELTAGDQTQSKVIVADEIQSVTFTNAYNEELVPGTGTVNHFEKDENDVQNNGWKWTQLPGSQDGSLKSDSDQTETGVNGSGESESGTTPEVQIPQE